MEQSQLHNTQIPTSTFQLRFNFGNQVRFCEKIKKSAIFIGQHSFWDFFYGSLLNCDHAVGEKLLNTQNCRLNLPAGYCLS